MRQPVAMEIVSFCEGNIVTGKWYCHRNFKPSFGLSRLQLTGSHLVLGEYCFENACK